MDINKEREAFEASLTKMKIHNLRVGTIFDTEKNEYFASDVLHPSEDHIVGWINFSWKLWQEKTTPEGFVLVSTENISTFYQDDSEPENFCTYEADLDNLGDGLDEGGIMVVNKYTQAELTKEKFYGAWCEIETTCGTTRKFKIFKTYDEAKQAMIEAQEQK